MKIFIATTLLLLAFKLHAKDPTRGIQINPLFAVAEEQLETGFFDPFGDQVKINPSYRSAIAGLRISGARFFVDLETMRGLETSTSDNFDSNLDIEKNSSRISLGYIHRQALLLYVGASTSETVLRYPDAILPSTDLTSEGAFIGAGYVWHFANSKLTLKTSYSARSARIKSDALLVGDQAPQSDGEGLSLDAIISVPLSRQLSIDGRFHSASYEYDSWTDFEGNPVPLSTAENLSMLMIGIRLELNGR